MTTTHPHTAPPPIVLAQRAGRLGAAGGRTRPFIGRLSAALTLPVTGLTLYLYVIHSYRLPLGWVAALIGLAGIFLQSKVRFPAPLLWVGAYLIWAAVAGLQTEYGSEVQTAVVAYAKIWLIFLVALNAIRSRPQWNFLLLAWLSWYALFPVRGILVNFALGFDVAGRYAWNFVFGNPNDFALITLPMLALSVAILQGNPPKWARLSAVVGVIVLPLTIFLTQSRGGILALATTGTLIFLQHRRRAQGIVVGLLAIGTLVLAAPSSVWQRMAALGKADTEHLGEIDSSAEQRFEIWKVAGTVFRDHPLFGVGLGSYPKAHSDYMQTGRFPRIANGERDAHSSYLTLLAETGVPGFLLFLGFLVSLFRTSLRQAREIEPRDPRTAQQIRIMLAGVVGLLQAAIFGSVFHLPFLYLHASMILVLGTLASQNGAILSRRGRGNTPGRMPVMSRRSG